ncbi:MAG TPA: DUF2934 domain-containing protein [Acidisoma sp.]|uniref:DUF2934 domain-containing protein n=1 Tax=Acidisoma sp. TaxID=1872115 RepID=UPI002C390F2B|nr:DUF2934 domain-containing protein [Acidisoma sp.]HTI02093.1 DUF2934 domain-containing protein [Acidisoma sp.]
MSNPLKFDPAREELIRTRAYHLWQSEGQPHGRAAEFWERASELVLMEESGNPGQLPNPQAEGRDPRAPEGVEEAFLQENLGEFPGQLTDQGDDLQAPKAKKPAAKAANAAPKPPATPAGKPAAKAGSKQAAKAAAKSGPKPSSKSAKPGR